MEEVSRSKNVREEIAIVAGPRGWTETRESWLATVPRKVKTACGLKKEPFTFRTVRSLWNGEIDDPEHWAARDIRRAAELIKARQETTAIAVQLASTAGALRAVDQDFYCTQIDRLERIARQLSGQDSPGNKG